MENNVGKRIANLRKKNGWSQMDLAKKLNVSDKAISKWENGGMPSVDLFPKLSKIFNVSIDYLMLGEEEIEEKESVSIIDEKSQEIELKQADFSVEELSIEDIELILADQRDLYTEIELNLLKIRLEELQGKSFIEKEDLPRKIVCSKCGVEITDTSAKFCEYCNCDFAIYKPEQEEYEEYEEYEDEEVKKGFLKITVCPKCGTEITDNSAEFCEYCNYDFSKYYSEPNEDYEDTEQGIGCLGYGVAFLFPLIGLIWAIVKSDKGVIIFSIIMMLINIIFAIVLQNTILSWFY